MKKFLMLGMTVLILSFGLLVVGCDTDDNNNGGSNGGSSSLTVTGLGSYNGKYFYGSNGSTLFLLSSSGNAAQISGGSVSLSVKNSSGVNYTGSETITFAVYILNSANVQSEMQGGATPVGSVSVTFNNGNGGSVAFTAQ